MGMPGRRVSPANAIPALGDLMEHSSVRSRPATTADGTVASASAGAKPPRKATAKHPEPPAAVVTPGPVTR